MANNTDYPNVLHKTLDNLRESDGKLFDYQKNVFNFMTKMNQRGILLYHSVGSGKCMAAGTMILMHDGTQKEIQNIKVGDKIMGDDSSPREVLSLASGKDQMFNVWYGSNKYTVNSDHVLCLKTDTYPYCHKTQNQKTVFYLKEGNVKFKEFSLEEDETRFMKTCTEKIIHVTVKDYLSSPDLVANARGYKVKVNFKSANVKTDPLFVGAFNARKGIPVSREYIINDIRVRERLIAGVINSKGKLITRKGVRAYSLKFQKEHKKFMNQIVFSLNSMGILHNIKKNNDQYIIIIYGKELNRIAQHNGNLAAEYGNESIEDGYKINVKFIGDGQYYGFTISGNRRYLLSDCTVTHNTMTSVSIAEHFKLLGRDIIVLSSKALQINYKKEITKFRGDENFDNYSFVTSNARNMISKITNDSSKKAIDEMLNHVNKTSLDNKVIIIDEAHNLFNSIVNGSAIANEFYEMVLNAKNIKLILMTGTPVINDPFELAICYNMIVGNLSDNKKKKTTIMPEYYTDFVKYFVAPNRSGVLNEDKFRNRIFGLTSYYGDFYTTEIDIAKQLKNLESKENYPDRLPIKFEVVKMSELQSINYLKARETEKLENAVRGSGIVKEASMTSTSYRIKSRQMSNIYIPDEGVDDINKCSTKIAKIIENITSKIEEPGTVLVYSTFLKYGVEAIAAELEKVGIHDGNSNAEGYKYMIFSGQQTQEEKENILATFNSQENTNGKLIKIIMITKSGTEGLDLKNVRHLHITEPYWNFSLIQQVIARGVRYKSHSNLPEDLRNVQVYIYLSDYNKDALKEIKERQKEIEKTTDINMITNSIKNQELITKFLKTIASTSIECKFYNQNKNYECYTCKPTNEKLYVEDIHTDMKTSNKCIKTKQVVANEIMVDDEIYYYTDTGDVYKKTEESIYVKVIDDNIVSQVMSSIS